VPQLPAVSSPNIYLAVCAVCASVLTAVLCWCLQGFEMPLFRQFFIFFIIVSSACWIDVFIKLAERFVSTFDTFHLLFCLPSFVIVFVFRHTLPSLRYLSVHTVSVWLMGTLCMCVCVWISLQGVVIKYNANQRYATTAITASIVRQIASNLHVPLQVTHQPADLYTYLYDTIRYGMLFFCT